MTTNDCAIVELTIKDEGVGMDSTTLQNLFQPFLHDKIIRDRTGPCFREKKL
ncbi:hypothetical protein OL548_10685 [Lysinibacillus sp. MHQ-1]|nr:hypothetical protein OL548_10685 [Lysinibacillus sp. MHQ-1]